MKLTLSGHGPKIILAGAGFLLILFLIPFIREINVSASDQTIARAADLIPVLPRTLIFAFMSSLAAVVFGFVGAVLLYRIKLTSTPGKFLSLLIVPVVMGTTSAAFIWKLILGQSAFFDFVVNQGKVSVFILLIAIQCWQFGFLFLYLFWLNLQNIPRPLFEYAESIKVTRLQRIRDLLIPYSRNLLVLLFLMGFVFNFYEDAKNQFIFKASEGTGTELITHWLYRTYHSALLIKPEFAVSTTFGKSILIFLAAVVCFVLGGGVVGYVIKKLTQARVSLGSSEVSSSPIARNVFFCLALAGTIGPVIIAIGMLQFSDPSGLSILAGPVLITFVAAALSSLSAIIFAVVSRVGWKRQLGDFNRVSLLFLAGIYLLQLVPPLVISIIGFRWLKTFGYSSDIGIVVVWVIGHILVSFAVLASFVVYLHFSVRTAELEYLFAYRIPMKSIVVTSFLKRFKLQYILTFLFALSFIWNEAVINRVLSDKIPSFAANLEMLVTGKASDYSKGSVYLGVSLGLAILIIAIWNVILVSSSNKPKTP